MRKIIPFLLIISIWFIGCSDDDNSGNFIGSWVAGSQIVTNCQTASRNGPSDLSCDDATCYRLVLNGDKTYSFQRGLPVSIGTWDVDDFLFLCTEEEGESSCEKFAVQFSGVSMILTSDSTSSGCITAYIFDPEATPDTTSTE